MTGYNCSSDVSLSFIQCLPSLIMCNFFLPDFWPLPRYITLHFLRLTTEKFVCNYSFSHICQECCLITLYIYERLLSDLDCILIGNVGFGSSKINKAIHWNVNNTPRSSLWIIGYELLFLFYLKHIWFASPALLICQHLALIIEVSTAKICQHWHSGKAHVCRSGRCTFKTAEEFKVGTIQLDAHEKETFINVKLIHVEHSVFWEMRRQSVKVENNKNNRGHVM